MHSYAFLRHYVNRTVYTGHYNKWRHSYIHTFQHGGYPYQVRPDNPPRLLDQVRNVLRCKHYSIRTEYSYIDWIKRYIYFHNKQHPESLGESHISSFLSHLAVDRKVASSTQNQALCGLVFLYREVLKKELGDFQNLIRAKRPHKLPEVFTREEIKQILLQLEGSNGLPHRCKSRRAPETRR